ncbi:hypothetical protein QBC40DRAFT_278690 [Triangularia verruculosa]|uniref:AttH domain-containing protein n=1 Tax=Triangularia verruculosa TaxID=2587418 RepID=A0AAN7AWP6_9PEZI|nr:hypothetical protein QBC40DRAFT_278690 [Triangularia verruculosa]
MSSEQRVSKLHFPAAITDAQVALDPFIPGSPNSFTKLPDNIGKATWEVWYFDALSPSGDSAVTISFWRDAMTKEGFRAQVHALLPDGTTVGSDNPLLESTVASDSSSVTGTWCSPASPDGETPAQEASFKIRNDATSACLSFKLATVQGTLDLATSDKYQPPNLPDEKSASFTPGVYLVRSIPLASAAVDLTFSCGSSLSFTNGSGAHQRNWSSLPWPVLMDLNYYLAAEVGPYTIRLMHITSRLDRALPYRVNALLFRDNQLVLNVTGREHVSFIQPFVLFRPLFDGGSAGKEAAVRGTFPDMTNTGFLVDFVDPSEKRHWQFEVGHFKPWWNYPTGPPQLGTGNSGFLERLVGGLVSEQGQTEGFEGRGLGGQCTVPDMDKLTELMKLGALQQQQTKQGD